MSIGADAKLVGSVVIATLVGFDDDGAPFVRFARPGLTETTRARTLAELRPDDLGKEVAILFEAGDRQRPIIAGRLLEPDPAPVIVERDGERLELSAAREVTLRCGKASITLTSCGKVLIRGTYLLSRSSGVNKIKGGTVQLN